MQSFVARASSPAALLRPGWKAWATISKNFSLPKNRKPHGLPFPSHHALEIKAIKSYI